MYAIIVKDTEDVYEVLSVVHTNEELRVSLDSEWDKGLPIIGMNISDHKTTAFKGATWNGTSFNGVVKEAFNTLSKEEHEANRWYAFLCDNKIIYRMTAETGTEKASLYDAAFSGEVFLVKCSFAIRGSTVSYNKTTREISVI